MKKIFIAIWGLTCIVACNNNGGSSKTTDTTNINTKTSSPADGGPNNGLGDTTSYNRMNDTTTSHDTTK